MSSKKTLAELRNERNLTQKELSEAIDISSSAIAMYETGERTPPIKKAKKIAAFFNVKIDDIFFGQEVHELRAKDAI